MSANADTLARFIDAVWNRGDLDAIDSFVADTYTVAHDPGDPWDHQTLSVAELKDRVEQSRAPFPDQVFTIVHTVLPSVTVCTMDNMPASPAIRHSEAASLRTPVEVSA